jgi:RHS repeat-associated protein
VKRQNRLSSDGHYHYEYDGEGHLIRKIDLIPNGPEHTTNGYYHDYSWDHRGRLLAVEYHSQGDPGALVYRVDYGYDALGRQIAKKVDYTNPATADEFVGYVNDGSRTVFEVNLAAGANVNKITSSYFYAPGGDVAAVDQAGKTIWNFADASGTVATVGYADPAGAHHWKLLHRNYDQFGQAQKFSLGDNAGTLKDYLGDEADTALLNAPEFFAGQAWDEEAKLYDFGSRWYDPFSGRYAADGGGSNGYRFMENGPTRDRFVSGGLSDADLDSLYGDSWWNGLQRSVGETVRWGVGDKALAGASNTTLYLGVGVTSVVAAVGIVYAAPFLASGAQAAGAWAAGSVAAGAQATGATVGAYLGKQAALSAVQTGVETAAAWGLGGDVSFSGVLGSFATNFGVNSLTGGAGVFARNGIEIAAGTAYDVARGENFGSSLAFNAAGSIGGEALFRGAARGWRGLTQGVATSTAGPRALAALDQSAERLLLKSYAEDMATVLGKRQSNPKRGAVLSVLRDRVTGEIFDAQNRSSIPGNLHPLLQERLIKYIASAGSKANPVWGIPGSHSEIWALNSALLRRESLGIGVQSMDDFAVYNVSLWKNRLGTIVPRCGNCRVLTEGVRVLSGS